MADAVTPTPTPTPEAAQPDASATPTPDTPTPDTLGDGGKKALEAERRARRDAERSAADLAAKVKAFEDRDKSDAERMADQIASLKAEAEAAKADALRSRIVNETGLPANLAKFLPTGGDEEALRTNAAELLAAMAPAGPRTPAPDPAQGAKPGTTGPTQLTAADIDRMTPEQVVKARTEGRFDDLLAGKQT